MVLPKVLMNHHLHSQVINHHQSLTAPNRSHLAKTIKFLGTKHKKINQRHNNFNRSLLCSSSHLKLLSWMDSNLQVKTNNMEQATPKWQQWLKADKWDLIMVCKWLIGLQCRCNSQEVLDPDSCKIKWHLGNMALKITRYSQW